jgi:predicted RNase H-like HicB family nuclease
MATTTRKPLAHYLDLEYPFQVITDPDGGYVIVFPDLPGCMTQVETAAAIGPAADEARRLWITTEYEAGEDIPSPSYPEQYSGKFHLRLPRSLHRRLAELAERDGVSLNQCVVTLLARAEAESRGASPSSRRPATVRGTGSTRLRRVASGG